MHEVRLTRRKSCGGNAASHDARTGPHLAGTCAISGRPPATRKPDATKTDIMRPCGDPSPPEGGNVVATGRFRRSHRPAGAYRRTSPVHADAGRRPGAYRERARLLGSAPAAGAA